MRAAGLLFGLLAAGSGWGLSTELLTTAELRTRVRPQRIADFNKTPFPVRTPHFTLTQGEHFQLAGRDKLGRAWSVQLPDAGIGAYRGVGAEQNTYYFHGYTGGAGFAPPTWILALSFDDSGRPVPFYFFTQGSMEDLFNLDGKGPQLLQQDYWGNFWEDPGYYVTTLYEKRGAYWQRADGRHGTHTFPTFEKWSVRWEKKPALLVPKPVTEHAVKDFSNDPERGRRISLGVFDVGAIQDTRARHRITGLERGSGGEACFAAILWTTLAQTAEQPPPP
jgi:hypothetical protein